MNNLAIYQQCAPQMQTGDSLLYIGKSCIGWTIQEWTKYVLLRSAQRDRIIFSHGNMVLRFPEYEGKTDRRWVLDARSAGVFPVLLSDYLATYDGQVYWYPLRGQYDYARLDIGCYAMTLAGRHYDFLGLLKNAIGLVSADMRALFCTESIFLCYRDGGHIVIGEKAPRPDMVPLLGVFNESLKLI